MNQYAPPTAETTHEHNKNFWTEYWEMFSWVVPGYLMGMAAVYWWLSFLFSK